MGRSWFSTVLLPSVILLLLLPTGFGRKTVKCGHEKHAVGNSYQGKSREMMELDYVDAGPNVNAKSGYLFPPPPPRPDY